MSMELRIVHTTGFRYDGSAVASYNEARLTPQTEPGQIVAHTRLDVTPTPWTYDYRDYFGTQVTAFEVHDPHERLSVVATTTVHTDRGPAGDPALSWTELRAEDVSDRFTEYLVVTPRVAPPDDLAARVRELGAAAATPTAAACAVSSLIHEEIEYVAGSTEVETSAADSWAARAGVCQDMAHLVIGGLRTLGIPARYVSGYLHPDTSPRVGEPVTGESHAWVEWWDDGWRGFDPTNDQEPEERHVVVARGRDYADVRPLGGIFSGAGTSSMFVDVTVTRLR